jgi:hypothetical protein
VEKVMLWNSSQYFHIKNAVRAVTIKKYVKHSFAYDLVLRLFAFCVGFIDKTVIFSTHGQTISEFQTVYLSVEQ